MTTNTYINCPETPVKLDYFRLSAKLFDKHPTEYLGKFAQFSSEDDSVVVTISDGTSPIGPIEDVNFCSDWATVVGVRLYKARIRTTQIDHEVKFAIGVNLFVNYKGKLTTNQRVDTPTVGVVIEPPRERTKFVEMLFL